MSDEVEDLKARVEELERLVAELTERLDSMHEITGDEKAMLKWLWRVDPLGVRIGAIEARLDRAKIPN